MLIRPIQPPSTTESGLEIVRERQAETLGEVVAVGPPRVHPFRSDALRIARDLDECDALIVRSLVSPPPLVDVGDTVVLSLDRGLDLHILNDNGEDERFVIVDQDDILAVIE